MKKAVEELLKHPENMGLSNISAGNATMDLFRQDLERGLGRPVIDETGLEVLEIDSSDGLRGSNSPHDRWRKNSCLRLIADEHPRPDVAFQQAPNDARPISPAATTTTRERLWSDFVTFRHRE